MGLSDLNEINLIGRLGRDPETRMSRNDKAICKFSVATSDRYNGVDETEWHSVVVFGKTAEAVQRYLTKGSQVYVKGKKKTNRYEDKNGVTRYDVSILAEKVMFLGGYGSSSGGGGGGEHHHEAPQTQQASQPTGSEDDVPF